ncbi:MAG: NAD(P)/FAD-dependent oxidoreductase [Solirubrobacteraceae bacterium]|nr:NAD(P)/FAD-dependent oxidoreductase [Solirubrobacteraceae bacterium]
MTDDRRHDVVIVGGGHNGLTCATYLARAGFDVAVVEARETVGGCASTLDMLGGARVNVCNCDHSLIRGTGVIEELDLAAHGLQYLELDPAQIMAPWDGSPPWMLFRDVDRTLQSLAHSRPKQVEAYRRYVDELTPAAELVLEMMAGPPRVGSVARRLARRRGRGVSALLRLSRSSCADVLARYFDDASLLSGASTTGPAVWGLPPQTPGTGLGALGYVLRHISPVGRPVGGSGVLTDALARALLAAGGTILTGTRVRTIHSSGGRATGVTLDTGVRLDARAVVATGDPRATFVDLLETPPAPARKMVGRWASAPGGEGYESKLDAVVDHPPRLLGLTPEHVAAVGTGPETGTTLVMTPTMQELQAVSTWTARGEVPALPPMLANTPSVLDPSVAGQTAPHVFSLEVLFTPYALRGGWEQTTEPQRWLELFAQRVEPGFLEGIRETQLTGPVEYERDFSMPRGYAPSFAGGPLSALFGRQKELTRYRTDLPGLYLSGAGTFPGAGVSGAPGRNAAGEILRDLRAATA